MTVQEVLETAGIVWRLSVVFGIIGTVLALVGYASTIAEGKVARSVLLWTFPLVLLGPIAAVVEGFFLLYILWKEIR